jgi:signal recognition particle subunit SRP54
MPGMGQMREAIDSFDEREVDRIEAIINSMTPTERDNPKIINGSRRARIARGSGTTTTNVNQLLNRFSDAQKMMRQMSRGGGMPAMPGMPPMPGMAGPGKRGGARQQPSKGKKGKSGNPAKRAQQEREALARALGGGPAGGAPAAAGSAFGLGAKKAASEAGAPDLSNLDMDALKDILG